MAVVEAKPADLIEPQHPHWAFLTPRFVFFAVLGIVAFALLYGATIRFYFSDVTARDATYTPGTGAGTNAMDVTATVLAVDTARNTATIRLTFTPRGSYAAGPDVLSKPLRLSTNSTTGAQDRVLNAGRAVIPEEITIDLDGDVSDYPIDRYTGRIDLDFAEGATVQDVSGPAVPIRLNFKDALRGLDAYPALDATSKDGDVSLAVTITRSRTTMAFAAFIMFATALVTAVVVMLVSLMILQRRKFEFGMLGWIAGLLFALPAVRNIMPGVPSVGALSDYIVLFWALGFLVAAMVWVAVVWVRNPAHQ
ncbi:MAG TPA: DUF4436 family protein [Chloroflexota bacterium]